MPERSVSNVGSRSGTQRARVTHGPLIRALVVCVSYLVLFQNSAIPAAMKNAFVALVIVLGISAAQSVSRRLSLVDPSVRRDANRILLAALLITVYLFLQLATLVWSPVPLDDWIRDALNYALIPAMLAIGLDLGLAASRRQTMFLTIGIGFAGALSFAGGWLSRRGAEDSVLGQVGLASSFVSFAGICICLAWYFSHPKAKILFFIVGLAQLGILLLGGGRSTLLYAVALVAFVILANSLALGTRMFRGLIAVAIAGTGLQIVVALSSSLGGGVAANRFDWFERLFTYGSTVVSTDGSAIARSRAYQWSLDIWSEHVLFGRGLGHWLPSVTTGEPTAGTYTLDTPFIALAKFGIVGTVVLVVAISIAFTGLHGRGAMDPASRTRRLFVASVAFLCVFLLPNGFPLENRGFPLMMLLTAAVAFSLVSHRDRVVDSALRP